MINAIIEGLIGGYLFDRALRFIPPKKMSPFDSISWDQLKARNNWIENCNAAIFVGGLVAIYVFFCVDAAAHNKIQSDGVIVLGNGWIVVFWFCFPVFLNFLFIGIVMLPQGFTRFREYWRYHELKNRIRLAVLLSIYIPWAALGAISAVMLFV
jgi:hypothetical protein